MSKEHVVRVTDAQHSHEVESAGRMRRYLILMGIRMVCFIVAAFTTGWVRWTAAAGAIVLPWIAVVVANTVRRKFYEDTDVIAHPPTAQPLDAEPAQTPHPNAETDSDVVVGEVVYSVEGSHPRAQGES